MSAGFRDGGHPPETSLRRCQSLKRRFWSGLREAINKTITDPRILEIKVLELVASR